MLTSGYPEMQFLDLAKKHVEYLSYVRCSSDLQVHVSAALRYLAIALTHKIPTSLEMEIRQMIADILITYTTSHLEASVHLNKAV